MFSHLIACAIKIYDLDPVLTQNGIGTGRAGRKQWKIRRANGGKKHKSEPKRLRFALETTYGPEGRGFESLTACHPETVTQQRFRGFALPFWAGKERRCLSNVFQTACEFVGHPPLARCIYMPIDVSGGLDVAVSHPFLYVLEGKTIVQQQACAAVTQVMEAYPWQSRPFQHSLQHMQDAVR